MQPTEQQDTGEDISKVSPDQLIDVFGRKMTPEQVLSHAQADCRKCHGKGAVYDSKADKMKMCRCIERNLTRKYGPRDTDDGGTPGPEKPKPDPSVHAIEKAQRLQAKADKLQSQIDEIDAEDRQAAAELADRERLEMQAKDARESHLANAHGERDAIMASIRDLENTLNLRRKQLELAEEKVEGFTALLTESKSFLRGIAQEIAAVKSPRARLRASLEAKRDKVSRRLALHKCRYSWALTPETPEKTPK